MKSKHWDSGDHFPPDRLQTEAPANSWVHKGCPECPGIFEVSSAQDTSEAGNIWAQKEDFSLPGRSRLRSRHLALLGQIFPWCRCPVRDPWQRCHTGEEWKGAQTAESRSRSREGAPGVTPQHFGVAVSVQEALEAAGLRATGVSGMTGGAQTGQGAEGAAGSQCPHGLCAMATGLCQAQGSGTTPSMEQTDRAQNHRNPEGKISP